MKYLLWILQILLALIFLFAGTAKLLMPTQALEAQAHMSGVFLKAISVAEILGALGLVLPGLFKIRQGLTPLAALGLLVIMIGATVVMLRDPSQAPLAFVPAITGILAAFVAYGRWRLVPRSPDSRPRSDS